MSVKTLPPRLQLYVGAIVALGGAAIALSITQLASTPFVREWMLFTVLGVLAGTYAVKVPGISARISVSDTFFLASGMLFGPAPAMLAMAIDSSIMSWRRSYSRVKLLFNACGPALSMYVATHAFFALSGGLPLASQPTPISSLIVPLAAMTGIWFVLNSGLTAAALSLESGAPLLDVWKRFAVFSLNYAAAASAAFSVVIVLNYADLTTAAAVLPVVFIFHITIRSWVGRFEDAQEHIAKVDRLYLSTVETLATAIEAKDGVTHDHIRRVQHSSVALAKALGVHDEQTIKAIEAAALLHDTGKLAVPEHILNKPGKLTSSEFDQMKRHVDVGADILSAIDFPYPVVPIVRCHHENWDGSGYPRGVRGDDIPIGARILSVVDCYDALTSDRPYRRALDREAAIAILLERRGTMYDPLIVDTFIEILPAIAEDVPPSRRNDAALAQISQSASTMLPAPPPVEATPDTVVEQLGEIISLTKVVHPGSSIVDVMALATATVRRVVGRGTCAIYLLSPDGRTLTVEHASGPLAEPLTGTSIEIGQKLSGWVAAHRRTIANSDAQLDLCDVVSGDIGPHACLSTALCDGDTLAGVLTVYRESTKPFAPADTQAFELMAPHLARLFTPLRQSRAGAPVRDLRVVGGSQSLRLQPTGTAGALATLQEKRVRRLHERETLGHRSPSGHS
jgi:putative nucleotidyltransferase with HDIG domain